MSEPVAKPVAVTAGAARRPSIELLKFQQGVLVFCTAVLSALFIAAPNTKQWGEALAFGRRWDVLYLGTIKWLVICVAATTLVALAVHLFQNRVDGPGKGWLWLAALLTLVATLPGIRAAAFYFPPVFG